MANEVTAIASLAYLDALGKSDSLATAAAGVLSTPGTLKYNHVTQTINTSETALKLGDLSTLGYCMIVNRDSTNYVDVKVATSGAIFTRLDAAVNADGNGGFCLLKLGSGAQAPYAIANTGACIVDIFLIST